MRNEDTRHQDQVRILKGSIDTLERKKAAVKNMLDMASESSAVDKRRLEDKISQLEAEVASLRPLKNEVEKLRSGEVLPMKLITRPARSSSSLSLRRTPRWILW